MKNKLYSRRKFITKYIYAGSFLVGGAAILGCGSMTTLAQVKPPVPPEGSGQAPGENPQPAAQDTVKTVKAQDVKAVQKNPCDDMTGVSPAEIEKRKKLAYVNKSPIPDSTCSNCALYMPPAEGKACGGCLLFKGPVRAEGYCAYWAPVNK